MPPAFIYFDLGNVLLTFDRQRAFRQMAEVAGISADQVESALFDSGLQDRYEHGSVSSRGFYEEFSKLTGTAADYDQLLHAGSEMFELNCPVIPIVAHLRSAGYRLGILSNTCEAHWQHVGQGRFVVLREYFEQHVLSYEVGAMKPAARIYEEATAKAGVDAGQVFFCDDHPENVEGARQFGWDAELFNSSAKLAADLRRRGVEFNY